MESTRAELHHATDGHSSTTKYTFMRQLNAAWMDMMMKKAAFFRDQHVVDKKIKR